MPSVLETLQVAVRHHESGQLEQAEALYRQVLRVDPSHPHGLHLMGVVCHQQGRSEAAVEYLNQAIPSSTPTAEIYHNRAIAYFALGKIDEAMADCRRVLEIDPDHITAQNNLAHALNEKNAFQEAAPWCRRALKLDPQRAVAHLNLGRALKGQGKLDEALASYQRSLELDPDCAETHNNLGNLHRTNGQLDEAVAAYERAVRIEPEHLRAMRNLGTVLHRQQKFPQAESAFRKALAVEPDDIESHVILGLALERQERADEALACFRRALEIKPDCAAAMAGLADCHEQRNDIETAEQYATKGLKLAPSHPRLNLILAKCEARQGRLQEAVDRLERVRSRDQEEESLADGTRQAIFFQLGQIHDRRGRTDEALAAYRQGNHLASREAGILGLDKATVLQKIDRVREFQPAVVRSWTPAPEDERPPVFMTGFPRSGTTLLDQILDSHPEIQTLEEKPSVASVKEVIDHYGAALSGRCAT